MIKLAARAPVTLLNGLTPSASYARETDVKYGELSRHKLDIYRTTHPKAGAPVIVFVHGGGWESGDKKQYKFVGDALASLGYDVVIPNYRLYPEVIFPEFLQDNAKAVAYTARVFPNRPIVLMGHSAGAYNVLMLGFAPQYLQVENLAKNVDIRAHIAGVVAMAPPSGYTPLIDEKWPKIFPDRFTGKDAVLPNITAAAPPTLLLHGTKDKVVGIRNTVEISKKIKSVGGKFEVKLYEGLGHVDVVKVLSRYFDKKVPLKADLAAFIDGLPELGSEDMVSVQTDFCRTGT